MSWWFDVTDIHNTNTKCLTNQFPKVTSFLHWPIMNIYGILSWDLISTASMVLELVKRLFKLLGQLFTIYLNNYFTSIFLFCIIRNLGIGAYGTTWPNSSSDFFTLLKELKKDYAKFIEWNTVCAILFNNQKVFCLGWQNNNIVLFFSTIYTIHNAIDFVKWEYQRPNKTFTIAAIARKSFRNSVQKILLIPLYIDKYNYNMGGIDLANQFWAIYEMHKTVFRSWFCMFMALLDIVIVNSY